MSNESIKEAAANFAEFWKDKGYEKGQSQMFWSSLLREVFGVKQPEKFISYEDQVMLDKTSFIDGYIDATHVMIEQKSSNKSLTAPIKQSDGTMLSPYQQAQRYSASLPYSKRPRWIVTCNFQEFLVYDMETPNAAPESILLKDLPKEYYRLQFLVDTGSKEIKREMELSFKAGELVGKLYDAIMAQYSPEDQAKAEIQESLNVLCVRLVFCLYAEDADVFGKHLMFHDYLMKHRPMRDALKELFAVLDQKPGERDPYLDEDLAAFPYVDGGLFENQHIVIPRFSPEIESLILDQMSAGFDWSGISPTIFGAVFESTLNPETRRSGGMHYTSLENIHKVVDPLFLDELKEELAEIEKDPVLRSRNRKLNDYQNKLASLNFLDPAAGSGNFLTETYLSLRRLENQAIEDKLRGDKDFYKQSMFLDGLSEDPVKVSIGQFYGIEVNGFAVTVAKTALWIAEHQMLQKTEMIMHRDLNYLPLKSFNNIHEGNALRMDWDDVISASRLSYIMGNPPFVGQQHRTKEQSIDMSMVFGDGNPETKLDYVICWYKKAVDYLFDTNKSIKTAFVSTNSICQGESVPTFWKKMADSGIDIIFAYTSFKWNSEANEKAAVICVIIGFTVGMYNGAKFIYANGNKRRVSRINAYLFDANDIWITSRINVPMNGFNKMTKGSEPSDGGELFLSAEERINLIKKYPDVQKYIKPFIGGDEFLNEKEGQFERYCLWFVNGNPSDYSHNPEIQRRLSIITEKRSMSSADRIKKKASVPFLFVQIRQPDSNYLVFPQHSSGDRKYIPIGFMTKDIIAGNACYIVPNASLYDFGLLMSNVHMAWTKIVCGRIGNGYRYSPMVYNNFPIPFITDTNKKAIEKTAQKILNVRKMYPECSLADMYGKVMPLALIRAHQENDRAVMAAYGFSTKMTEEECVAELMKMYQSLVEAHHAKA